MNINDFLNESKNKQLKASLEKILKGKDGKEIENILKNADMDEIKSHLKNIDRSKLDTDKIIEYINNNPDIAEKIKRYNEK